MKQLLTKLSGLKPVRIAIVLLSAILVLNTAALIYAITEDAFDTYQPTERNLLYTMENGDYVSLRSQLLYFSDEEIAKDETLSECYSVALYFENSVYYYAFAETDSDQAALYLQACQENAASMGNFAYHTALIDALFENYQPATE